MAGICDGMNGDKRAGEGSASVPAPGRKRYPTARARSRTSCAAGAGVLVAREGTFLRSLFSLPAELPTQLLGPFDVLLLFDALFERSPPFNPPPEEDFLLFWSLCEDCADKGLEIFFDLRLEFEFFCLARESIAEELRPLKR